MSLFRLFFGKGGGFLFLGKFGFRRQRLESWLLLRTNHLFDCSETILKERKQWLQLSLISILPFWTVWFYRLHVHSLLPFFFRLFFCLTFPSSNYALNLFKNCSQLWFLFFSCWLADLKVECVSDDLQLFIIFYLEQIFTICSVLS